MKKTFKVIMVYKVPAATQTEALSLVNQSMVSRDPAKFLASISVKEDEATGFLTQVKKQVLG